MRVVIAGATGFIGRHVCRELLAGGHEVVALTRDPERAAERLGAKVAVQGWDARSVDQIAAAVAAADGVVNLAGESVAPHRWTRARKDAIRESRVSTTRALAQALKAAPERPRVLVNASAVGYYGDRGEEELTEESPPGDDFLARVAQEWEAAAREAEPGARVAMVRFAPVLGPDGGMLKQMLTPFRLGIGGPLGNGRQWLPWVHVADVVGLIRFALDREEVRGPVNAAAPEPTRMIDFCRALAAQLRRPCLLPVPAPVLRLILGEAADMVLVSQKVKPAAAERLGYAFRFPKLAEALADLLSG